MEKRTITCISCPLGCDVDALVEGKEIQVQGNRCEKGKAYVINEILDPRRVVTSNVFVEGGNCPLVSVKTTASIPKGRMLDLIQELKKLRLTAPVHIGDLLIQNLFGTGIDVVATREVEKTCESLK